LILTKLLEFLEVLYVLTIKIEIMKKIVTMFIFASFVFFSFAQTSSADLLKRRDKEIKAIEKENIRPTKKAEKIEAVNFFYNPLLERAMDEEKRKAEAETPRDPIGSKVVYQGDQGSYSGRSISSLNGASAYAVVAQADANAYLTRQMANGASATISATPREIGLEGTIINKFRYKELVVRVEGINSGNFYKKTFLLGKDQSITDYLLPGTYKATVSTTDGIGQPTETVFTVSPEKTHFLNGNNVFWGVWGGTSW
jgi:hypothetical protein